jgi:hypothetical protein
MCSAKPAIDNLTVARHGQVVSFEFLLKTNPDWLFVIDRDVAIGQDGKTAQQLLDNPLVRHQGLARQAGGLSERSQLVHPVQRRAGRAEGQYPAAVGCLCPHMTPKR